MRLIKRGKFYHVRVWSISKGDWITKSTRETDCKRAEIEAHRITADIKSKDTKPRAQGIITLSDLGAMDITRAIGQGANPEISKSRIGYMWRMLMSVLGDIDINSINDATVEQYLYSRREGGISGQTIRRELQALRRGLEMALRRGMIHEIPKYWPKIKSDPPNVKRQGKLHPPEIIAAVFRELKENPAKLELEFALFTGLRVTELKKCCFEWVRPAPEGLPVKSILVIPASASKTKKERIVGLSDRALSIIKTRFKIDPSSKFVFDRSDHKKALERACKAVGLENNITLRDMRHTYATYGLAGTGDLTALVRTMGNSIDVADRYQSSTLERAAYISIAVEKMANRISETGTEEN